MKKQTKRKYILSLTFAVALFSAVIINMYYQNDIKSKTQTGENLGDSILVNSTEKEQETNEEDDEDDEEILDVAKTQEFFAEAELKRTKAHDNALDQIQKLIENNENSEEIEKMLQSYTDRIKTETDIENLITAKIGADCLCCINSDNAEVVVNCEAIDELYLLQISDIVTTQSGISSDKIVIVQAK